MLEKSDVAENAVACLHDERYKKTFYQQLLGVNEYVYSQGREQVVLDGYWHFTIDPHETGLRQKWYQYGNQNTVYKLYPHDYDPFDTETMMSLPSCWQMEDPILTYYEGSVWYSKEIDMSLSDDKRQFLRIGAANYETILFLNGECIGLHKGGNTPIYVELTTKARQGRNHLMIMVNNTRMAERIPMQNIDWFNYGGIYREITLFSTPKDYIKDFFIYLEPNGNFNEITLKIEYQGTPTQGLLEIAELGIKYSFAVDAATTFLSINAKPKLWSPDNPILYDVRLTIGQDQINDRVGFREIKVVGNEIYLNGQAIFLKGINVHEDDRRLGRLTNREDILLRYQHAKELGCNYLRLAHYPHHELAAQIADEVGLMLWEEIPVYWAIDFANPVTLQDGINQISELVIRDRNRASVIIWSVGNENADTDARLHFMSTLAATVRALDPSRMISAACLVNHHELAIQDRLAAHLDIIGINEYFGWYEPDFENLKIITSRTNLTKPVVITETGGEGVKAPHGGPQTGLFSEAYMADIYRKQVAALPALTFVRGFTPWLLYDYRSERRKNRYQRGLNHKGLICDDKRTKKEAFYVLQKYYIKNN